MLHNFKRLLLKKLAFSEPLSVATAMFYICKLNIFIYLHFDFFPYICYFVNLAVNFTSINKFVYIPSIILEDPFKVEMWPKTIKTYF